MTTDKEEDQARPDWHTSAPHTYTREAWAWEFQRRNPDYRHITTATIDEVGRKPHHSSKVLVVDPSDVANAARAWGCLSFEPADRPANEATVFWRPDVNPAVLPVTASPARRDDEAFDIHRLASPTVVLRMADGCEHVLLGDGLHRIQLEVRRGSLLDGPVRLSYELAGCDGIEPKLTALHRLLALQRLGHCPSSLYPPVQRAQRWRMALQALDASHAGASHREIASILWGDDVARTEWRSRSDYLRSRVRRTIHLGESMVKGGYLHLLQQTQQRRAVTQ
ncbi:MAG TPA: DUF2285 domain-containing protein [Alphaproteobacteria bacterium]|nr:DUF2285 domain-containing protein [Alphaproteobacteria bacterium]